MQRWLSDQGAAQHATAGGVLRCLGCARNALPHPAKSRGRQNNRPRPRVRCNQRLANNQIKQPLALMLKAPAAIKTI